MFCSDFLKETKDLCKEKTFPFIRAQKIHEFLKKDYNIGPWLVIVTPVNSTKKLSEIYKTSAVQHKDHVKHTCQYHFFVENMCGLNVEVALHVVRFTGIFEIKNKEKLKAELKSSNTKYVSK